LTEIKDKVADKISEMTGNKSPQDQAKDKASEAGDRMKDAGVFFVHRPSNGR